MPDCLLPNREPPAASATGASAADLARAHAVARRLLGCDHLAADAVQAAQIALWRRAGPPPDVRGWLVRAVVHRSRHLRRTLARRRRHEHAASEHCALHAGCANPLHVAIAHELGERLADALDSLPAAQREALARLAASAADPQNPDGEADAASAAARSATLRSRLHRARAALREALARRGVREPFADD